MHTKWKEVRLGDIMSITSGYAYKGEFIGKGDYVLLGMGCVSFSEKFLSSGARYYSQEVPDRYLVNEGDIVLATRQQSDNLPILGMPAFIPKRSDDKRLFIGANLYKVENNSEVDNKFIFWLLKTPFYVDYIKSCQTGTTVRMITKKDIESFTFMCPSLEEREKISKILWDIDDKIENNRKINENLEQQAQALFKSWFIDFEPFKDGKFIDSELGLIPEGWRVGTLDEIATITMGQSPSGESLNDNKDGIIFYQGRTEFGFRYPSIRLYTTEPSRYAEPNSVLLSVRAPVGDINRALIKCCIGRGLASIRSLFGNDSFLYYLMLSQRTSLDIYNGEGTVFGSINRNALEGLKIIIPPHKIIDKFDEIVVGIDSSIKSHFLENERLSTLCDTLLPKLMSGEIEV